MPNKIGWCTKTWNRVTGCTPESEGCADCWAKRMANRLHGRYGYPEDEPFTPGTIHPNCLSAPLHWRKPQRIFVSSMGDLFHKDVPDYRIDEVMGVILACSVFDNYNHTFMILTKRPRRMHEYFNQRGDELLKRWAEASCARSNNEDETFTDVVAGHTCMKFEEGVGVEYSDGGDFSHPENLLPLPNLWLGVSAENQDRLHERTAWLLTTPAYLRFVSLEPLLGPIDLKYYLPNYNNHLKTYLDWVICGGENGSKARPAKFKWFSKIANQTRKAKVPYFFKGWGDGTIKEGKKTNTQYGTLGNYKEIPNE